MNGSVDDLDGPYCGILLDVKEVPFTAALHFSAQVHFGRFQGLQLRLQVAGTAAYYRCGSKLQPGGGGQGPALSAPTIVGPNRSTCLSTRTIMSLTRRVCSPARPRI